MAFAGSGLFFFKFWQSSQDRFFFFFGTACLILAAEKIVWLAVNVARAADSAPELSDFHIAIYILRLSAFSMILTAIVDKNLIAKKIN